MQNATNEIMVDKDLGGEVDPLSLENFPNTSTTPKNRCVKGYLRYKIISGIKYWYYCRSVKTRGGRYKEKSVYIGNADSIYKMKQAARGEEK